MKLIFITLPFLLIGIVSNAQLRLKNKFTADHKLIKYTKVFIIPPDGFRVGSNSIGFGHIETGANVGAIQSNTPFQAARNQLTKKILREKKYKVIAINKYKINRLSAIWFELENEFYDRTTIKYILLIGNKHENAMIEAYCPKEYPLACLALKRAIFTVYYDRDSTHIPYKNS